MHQPYLGECTGEKRRCDSQAKVHNVSLAVQAECDKLTDPKVITAKYLANADAILKNTWDLTDAIMFKYADGWINEIAADGSFESSRTPYPDWWFKAVNYTNGPPPVPHRPPPFPTRSLH